MKRRNFGQQRGTQMVEFAIILPVFLLLVLGTIEIVWVMHAKQSMVAVSRSAARNLSISGAVPATITTDAENFLQSIGLPNTVTVTLTDNNCAPVGPVTAQISVPVNDISLTGDPFDIFTDGNDVVAQMQMRKECP